jgi:hypothetical protein
MASPAPRLALLTAAALVLAGCGSDQPHLQQADAAPLLALTRAIPREGACAQARDIRRVQARAIALVNAHRVPAALQGPFTSGVNALTEQAPMCLPSVPVSTPPAPPYSPRHGPGHGHGHGHDHHGPGKNH